MVPMEKEEGYLTTILICGQKKELGLEEDLLMLLDN